METRSRFATASVCGSCRSTPREVFFGTECYGRAGKTHLAIALSMKAYERGYRVAFATAQEWVSRLEAAQDRNQLEAELRRLERYHPLVVDEVGYLPGAAGRQPALRLGLPPLRTRLDHRHQQPQLRGSGTRSSATRWSPPL
jgi:uncharacterized protein (DUF58 family)